MTSSQENLLAFGVITVAAAAAWGWFSDKSRKLKKNKFNRELREKLESDRKTSPIQADLAHKDAQGR
ncbi:MAG: hypothetical protein ACYCZL_02590 [Polaromonas sp.]